MARTQCLHVFTLSSDEIAYTSKTVSFTKRRRSGSTGSFPRVPVQFLLSSSLGSKMCLINCTAKFPIEQLLHLIWVNSSCDMYGPPPEAPFSLSEPGDEAPLPGRVLIGAETKAGVDEFSGACGRVGVFIGVVLSTRGVGTEGGGTAASCWAAGGCSPREFSPLRIDCKGATFTAVGATL